MKKTNNVIKVFIAAISLLSVTFLNSCNKNIQDKAAPVEDNSIDDGSLAAAPIAMWGFDSSWTESVQNLPGVGHNKVKFSTTAQAHDGKAAFFSKDSGFVSYDKVSNSLSNLSVGLTVDFWLFAYPKEGGAQCVWCLPQTGQFWPTQHVLLDGYNAAQKDSGLIKIMFKANKAITYNEQWQVIGGIPHFYKRWNHIQYAYNGRTSKFTLKINDKIIVDHVVLTTDDPNNGGVPLGALAPNPGKHGIVIGGFQNQWDPALFGDAQPWMLPFKGRIDNLKIYKTAQF